MTKYMSLEGRFLEKVNKTESCWLWTGALNSRGYGAIGVNGKSVSAHRFAYETYIGEIPEGMVVCHSCDVRNCVNPAHLWAGTSVDNNRDMFEKDRNGSSTRRRTHCRRGHSFEEFEPIIYNKKQAGGIKKEYRVCKECKRINDSKRRGKNLEYMREYNLKNKDRLNEQQRNLYYAKKNKQTPGVGGQKDKATDF